MKSKKSTSSNKTTNSCGSFLLNTINTPKEQFDKKPNNVLIPKLQEKKPFLMISPKLVEEFDENNTKKLKLLFENRISQMQTCFQNKSETQIPSMESSSARVRKRTAPIRLSLRLPTQL